MMLLLAAIGFATAELARSEGPSVLDHVGEDGRHRDLRRRSHHGRRDQSDPQPDVGGPLSLLVARRQAIRIHVRSRRQLQPLRSGRRRQERPSPDRSEGPGGRLHAELGRRPDRIRHARRSREIASIKPDAGEAEILGSGHDPVLSPDGKRIAFTGEAPGGVTVFVMDADGSRRRQVVKEANPWGAVFPDWSPDGKRLVYAFKVGEGLELFTVDTDGGTAPRQLTRLGGVSTPAAWSPDGSWISFRHTDEAYWRDPERMKKVYGERPGDKRPVWVVRPDGTGAHVVECLRYQCAMDGSRAAWRPRPR